VNALAFELKAIRSTVVPAEIESDVWLLELKVATSGDPLGTVAGVQLVAVFQSPEAGFVSHVALPARAVGETVNQATASSANAGK
jgi:hypothetical protein